MNVEPIPGRAHVRFDERGEVIQYEPNGQYPQRVWRAMMLAPTIEVCEALLRGEHVPVDRLDPEWVARFSRRAA